MKKIIVFFALVCFIATSCLGPGASVFADDKVTTATDPKTGITTTTRQHDDGSVTEVKTGKDDREIDRRTKPEGAVGNAPIRKDVDPETGQIKHVWDDGRGGEIYAVTSEGGTYKGTGRYTREQAQRNQEQREAREAKKQAEKEAKEAKAAKKKAEKEAKKKAREDEIARKKAAREAKKKAKEAAKKAKKAAREAKEKAAREARKKAKEGGSCTD